MMWGIPTAVFLIAFFHRPVPGIIARELMQAFDATGALVGLLSATYFYAYAAFMVPGGLLIDTYGPRRVVAVGGAVMGGGALLMAAAASTPVLFAGRFVVGLGATVTFVGALKIASAWFPPSQFGMLSALTATAGVLGALVATAPLAGLVTLLGWRGALAGVGLVTVIGAAACAVFVRDRPPGPAGAAAAAPAGRVMSGLRAVLGNPHTWPPFLAFFCLYATVGNLMLWVVPYLRDVYGLGPRVAASYASASTAALLLAAPLAGLVSDRVVRRRKGPFLALALAHAALWGFFVLTLGQLPLGAVYGLLFVLGVASSAFVLTWPIGREVNPPHLAGLAVAVVNLGGFVGAAFTQGPLGALLDARWEGLVADGARVYPVAAYRGTFGVCALLALAAALVALLLRETHGRNIHAALREARDPSRPRP
jgi:MFS family permease